MTHMVATELLAVYSSKNYTNQGKVFQTLEVKHYFASTLLLGRQVAGKFVRI